MTDKQLILDAVLEMPERASFGEIINELRLLKSVRQGLEDTECGKVTPHEDVTKLLPQWLAESAGKTNRLARHSD